MQTPDAVQVGERHRRQTGGRVTTHENKERTDMLQVRNRDPRVRILAAETIGDLVWPSTLSGRLAKAMLPPLMSNGTTHYVRNMHAKMLALAVGQEILPLTVVDGCRGNSLVCSPYTHYLDFTAFELRSLEKGPKRTLLLALIDLLGPLFRACRMDRVVIVNGWPLSTSLYPELTQSDISAIRDELAREFPEHAIVFRTVDDLEGPGFKDALEREGFRLIYHRPTYAMNPADAGFRPSYPLRRDIKKLRTSDYRVVRADALEEPDIGRIAELYEKLYIQKYTRFNPQYTRAFFELVWRERIFDLVALKKNDRVDGFIAMHRNHKQIIDPFLGYDTELPQQLGIYRMLAALVYLAAKEEKLKLNYSAGVGEFKRRRGCELTVEYLAVYDLHLNRFRHIPWMALQASNRIAIPMMKSVSF